MKPQEILDGLEFDIHCNVGHPGGYGPGRMAPCARTAAWAVNYHDCLPEEEGDHTGTWCNHHLELFRLSINTQLTDNPGLTLGCTVCRKIYRSPDDFIWGATPINTRANHRDQ